MSYTPVSIEAVNRAQMSANIRVPEEPAGMIDAVNMNFDDKKAAKGQTIVVPVMPATSSTDFDPKQVPVEGSINTPVNVQVTIQSIKEQSNSFTGEQLLQLENTGVRDDMLAQFIGQAERTLRNELSAAATAMVKIGASRAIGTPGVVPFSTGDLKLLIQAQKVLNDNGAPPTDRHVIVNTSAYAEMLSTNLVSKANEAGSEGERRAGVIRNQYGFDTIAQDANMADHTAGTGTAFLVNHPSASTYAKLTKLIGVDTGSSGTIKLGDVVSIAADANKYVVNPAITTSTVAEDLTTQTITGAGNMTIGNPGLRAAWANNAAITIASGTTEGGTTGYAPSYAFVRQAVVGVVRPPAIESSPFLRVYPMKDNVSGITFLFGEAMGVGMTSWYVWIAYGFKVTQSEYVCLIMG